MKQDTYPYKKPNRKLYMDYIFKSSDRKQSLMKTSMRDYATTLSMKLYMNQPRKSTKRPFEKVTKSTLKYKSKNTPGKKTLYGPFYGWGSFATWLRDHYEESLLFIAIFPVIPATHLINLERMKGLSQLWSHPLVLNSGPLDWEFSVLTTKPLLHQQKQTKTYKYYMLQSTTNFLVY